MPRRRKRRSSINKSAPKTRGERRTQIKVNTSRPNIRPKRKRVRKKKIKVKRPKSRGKRPVRTKSGSNTI